MIILIIQNMNFIRYSDESILSAFAIYAHDKGFEMPRHADSDDYSNTSRKSIPGTTSPPRNWSAMMIMKRNAT